jgi:ABC-type amino acid transport substrate-binding protein
VRRPVAVTVALACVASTACGGGEDEGSGPAATRPAVVQTVARSELQRPGVLRVCADATSPPFAFRSGGRLRGFDVDLAREAARRLDLRPAWVEAARSELVPALLDGRCDVIASRLRVTYELQSRISMVPYLQVGQLPLARAGADVPATLCGARVVVLPGSAEEETAASYRERCARPPRIETAPSTPAAVELLASGRADAVFDDAPVARWFARRQPGKLTPVGEDVDHVNYGVGMGRRLDSLYFGVRNALRSMRSDGAFQRLQRRWDLHETTQFLNAP